MRLAVLAFLAVASAQNALYAFSGDFSTQRQKLNPNAVDYNGDCAKASSAFLFYTTFNYTFATAGVRGIYGANLLYVGVIAGSQGTISSDLCANSPEVYPLIQTANGFTFGIGPEYSFAGWFEAATYTFVVGGETGPFVGQIKEPQIQGTTSTANKWEALYSMPVESSACGDTSTGAFFDAQTYTATRTGYHTIYLAFAQNKTGIRGYQYPSGYPALTILKGSYSNAAIATLKCADVGTNWVAGRYSSSGSLNVQAYNVELTSGVTYTVIASGGDVSGTDGYVGNYGVIFETGTKYDFSSTNDVFKRPASNSCAKPSWCVPSDGEPIGNNYARVTFSVPKNTWFWAHSTGSSAALYLWYFYNENNVNKATCGSNFNCVAVESFIPGKYYYSGNTESFTVYATGAKDQEVFSNGYIYFYVLTGEAITLSIGPTPETNSAAAPSYLAALAFVFAALWA